MITFNSFLIALLVFTIQNQGGLVQKINDIEIISLINSLDSDKRYETDKFSVVVFRKGNSSGSAGIAGTDEITHSYLIGISEYDEYPAQSLYQIGDFYHSSIIDVIENNTSINLVIEHGDVADRKRNTFEITHQSVNSR